MGMRASLRRVPAPCTIAACVAGTRTPTLCAGLDPDNPRLQQFTNGDRIVVSEPRGDLPGAWLKIPESTALTIQPGPYEQQPFNPHAP